jgi:hypothetical protein
MHILDYVDVLGMYVSLSKDDGPVLNEEVISTRLDNYLKQGTNQEDLVSQIKVLYEFSIGSFIWDKTVLFTFRLERAKYLQILTFHCLGVASEHLLEQEQKAKVREQEEAKAKANRSKTDSKSAGKTKPNKAKSRQKTQIQHERKLPSAVVSSKVKKTSESSLSAKEVKKES